MQDTFLGLSLVQRVTVLYIMHLVGGLRFLGRVAMDCAICVKLYCIAAAVPIWKFGMSWTEYYYCTVDDGV